MIRKNQNSILLLYEGETEGEFYKLMISKKISPRKIRISYRNLKGVYNVNNKVLSKIIIHLDNHPEEERLSVFIAIDRDGDRSCESQLDIEIIQKKLSAYMGRIREIHEIIATKDIESWFFNFP